MGVGRGRSDRFYPGSRAGVTSRRRASSRGVRSRRLPGDRAGWDDDAVKLDPRRGLGAWGEDQGKGPGGGGEVTRPHAVVGSTAPWERAAT